MDFRWQLAGTEKVLLGGGSDRHAPASPFGSCRGFRIRIDASDVPKSEPSSCSIVELLSIWETYARCSYKRPKQAACRRAEPNFPGRRKALLGLHGAGNPSIALRPLRRGNHLVFH